MRDHQCRVRLKDGRASHAGGFRGSRGGRCMGSDCFLPAPDTQSRPIPTGRLEVRSGDGPLDADNDIQSLAWKLRTPTRRARTACRPSAHAPRGRGHHPLIHASLRREPDHGRRRGQRLITLPGVAVSMAGISSGLCSPCTTGVRPISHMTALIVWPSWPNKS